MSDPNATTRVEPPRAPSSSADAAPAEHVSYAGGRYVRQGLLGRGGMGSVYEAHDTQFDRAVAIKELQDGVEDGEGRFSLEAHLTGHLEHPGVPATYETGRTEAGRPWFAMRKINGRTLAAMLKDAPTLQVRLPLVPVVLKCAQTLAYAHQQGVIHRDIKPSNIIVGDFGEVVLLDWGVARRVGSPESSPASNVKPTGLSHTEAGIAVGTVRYMSPEQALGRNAELDERSDVFALGALLYQVLTGRPPYVAEGPLAHDQAMRADFPPPRTLVDGAPEPLLEICTRAMMRLPEARYRSAGEFARALETFESQALAGSADRSWVDRLATGTLTTLGVGLALLMVKVSSWVFFNPSVERLYGLEGAGVLFRLPLVLLALVTILGIYSTLRGAGRAVVSLHRWGLVCALLTLAGGVVLFLLWTGMVASNTSELQADSAARQRYFDVFARAAMSDGLLGLSFFVASGAAQLALWLLRPIAPRSALAASVTDRSR